MIQTISAVDKDEPLSGHRFYFALAPPVAGNLNFTLRDNKGATTVFVIPQHCLQGTRCYCYLWLKCIHFFLGLVEVKKICRSWKFLKSTEFSFFIKDLALKDPFLTRSQSKWWGTNSTFFIIASDKPLKTFWHKWRSVDFVPIHSHWNIIRKGFFNGQCEHKKWLKQKEKRNMGTWPV